MNFRKLPFLLRPFYRVCLGQTLCWLWLLSMTAEAGALATSQLPSDFSGPGIAHFSETLENAALLLLGVFCWRKASLLFEKRALSIVLAAIMTLCSLAVAAVPTFTASNPHIASLITFLANLLFNAAFLIQGIGVSFVVSRFDWRSVLLISACPVIVAALVAPALQLLPSALCFIVLVLLPPIFIWAICNSDGAFSTPGTSEEFDQPKLPVRYCLTAFAQGLSGGAVLGFILIALAVPAEGPMEDGALVIGSLLVLFTTFVCNLDYNRLLYKCGIPLLAIGLLGMSLLPGLPFVGPFIYLSAYYFMNTIMNCLNIYFIKQYRFSPVYIVGVATLALLAGKVIGSQGADLMAVVAGNADAVQALAPVLAVMLLVCALFCLNERNMASGWGVSKPDPHIDHDAFDVAMETLALHGELSEREQEVYRLLARGWSRKRIASELLVSEETVKSYSSKIYRKLGVHSRQELIEAIDKKSESVS